MGMDKWPALPFDLAQIALGRKYTGVLDEFLFSRRKTVVQNYYSGELQLVRVSQINMLTNQMFDQDRTRKGRPQSIAPLYRLVPKDEREQLSRVWVAVMEVEKGGRYARSLGESILGDAKRIKLDEGDEVQAKLDDDPSTLEAAAKKKRMIDEASKNGDIYQQGMAAARQLRHWLAAVVADYRKDRDASVVQARHQQYFEEEALREQARRKAQREMDAKLGEPDEAEKEEAVVED